MTLEMNLSRISRGSKMTWNSSLQRRSFWGSLFELEFLSASENSIAPKPMTICWMGGGTAWPEPSSASGTKRAHCERGESPVWEAGAWEQDACAKGMKSNRNLLSPKLVKKIQTNAKCRAHFLMLFLKKSDTRWFEYLFEKEERTEWIGNELAEKSCSIK